MTPSDGSTSEQLIIYGAGGHGLVVAESAVAAGWKVLGFVDDHATHKTVGSWPLLDESVLDPRSGEVKVIVAIGDNPTRRRVCESLLHRGCKLVTITHPQAWVSSSANIGRGVFIGACAVVQVEAHLDTGVIVNNGAVVEHHCHVGEFTHLAPGSVLGGRSRVGALSLIGLNAAVKPDVEVGDGCTIGVGAAVVRRVPSNQTVMGVPARLTNI